MAYACPTVQLAWQVAGTAEREGVPAVVLVRSHHDWPVPAQARYEAAEALAITTYSTVFNSSPKLAAADLLSLTTRTPANSISPSSMRSTSAGGSIPKPTTRS